MKMTNLFKPIKTFWLDLTDQTDRQGFTKKMRQEKRKLDKLFKQSKKER